jgi:uncharacterized protein
MSDAKDQHEPSMEEILASIRRIISEDGDDAKAAAPSGDDVLMLTEEVPDEDLGGAPGERMVAMPAEEPPAPSPSEPMVQLSDPEPEEEAPAPRAEPEPAPAPPAAEAPAPLAPGFGRRIISDTTATASLAALTDLVNRAHREPAVTSMPLGQSQRTLEELTRELLTPMLKAWLDANLPQLVERIVREEIGRLALDAQRR